MGILALHHVGYLVKDLSKSAAAFISMGFEVEREEYFDSDRMASFIFLSKQGTRIELVCPHTESDLFPLLKRYRNTPYHMCYTVDNLEETIGSLKAAGFLLFRDQQRAKAISDDAVVVFLTHIGCGIIELLQE